MLTSEEDRDLAVSSEDLGSSPDVSITYISNQFRIDIRSSPPLSDTEANLRLTTIFNKSVESSPYLERRKQFFLSGQPIKPSITSLLAILLRSKRKCSVHIYIRDVRFRCHMTTLQSYCSYFIERYNRKKMRLSSTEVTPMAFLSIYYWLLSDNAAVQRSGIIELFNAARYLGVQELLDQCWYCFDNTTLFQENSAFELFCEAIRFDMGSLQELMLSRICKYFLTIVASKEFLELNGRAVMCLLEMSNVGVNSEMEIFMSCIRWLDYDWMSRHVYLLGLMRCVRFKLLPPLFLRFLQSKQETKILYHITRCEEVKTEINKAFVFVTKEIYEKSNGIARYDLTNTKASEQRRWVFDKNCPYHHDLNCPKRQFLSYDDFLDYLTQLQSTNLDYHTRIQLIKDCNGRFECCSETDSTFRNIR